MAELAELLEQARQEIKRADHLSFVSLKYTRTVDVFKAILERLIAAYDVCITALLQKAKEQKKITDVPVSIIEKANKIKQLHPDEAIVRNIDFYLQMRKIDKAKFDRAREYRRHVTMTVNVEGENIEVNIDIINEYFAKTKEFVATVSQMIEGEQ